MNALRTVRSDKMVARWHRCAVHSIFAWFRGCRRGAPQPPANRSQRSALPGTRAFGSGDVVATLLNPRPMAGKPSELPRPRLLREWKASFFTRTAQPSSPQAGGLPAISRGLSAATSPVWTETDRTAKAVPALGHNQAMDIRRFAGTAARCGRMAFGSGGVVAALLNPRLIADNPPGCCGSYTSRSLKTYSA